MKKITAESQRSQRQRQVYRLPSPRPCLLFLGFRDSESIFCGLLTISDNASWRSRHHCLVQSTRSKPHFSQLIDIRRRSGRFSSVRRRLMLSARFSHAQIMFLCMANSHPSRSSGETVSAARRFASFICSYSHLRRLYFQSAVQFNSAPRPIRVVRSHHGKPE